MAPLFCAFDRPTYRAIVPQHLADCLLFPPAIIEQLRRGSFCVSITNKSWRSVGLDEAHEMLINKDCKMAVAHPNTELLNRTATYFPFRSKTMHNFREQIRPKYGGILDDLHISSKQQKMKTNITLMKKVLAESHSLPINQTDEQRPAKLRNAFTSTSATANQEKDLLTFRETGQKHFEDYIERSLLQKKKDDKPLKFHRLKTFSTVIRVTKSAYKKLEKEKKFVTECLKRRLLCGGKVGNDEQYLELPRSIADENGLPHKGMKCFSTKFYEKKYGSAAILSNFPENWLPRTVILEGMFIINSSPLRIHCTMQEYTRFLLKKYTLKYFTVGVNEVHIIFDNPGRFENHPKSIERNRRDAGKIGGSHTHSHFSDEAKIPSKWQEMLKCRECKKRLIAYMADSLLMTAPEVLQEGQRLIVAGGQLDMDERLCLECNQQWH